jgi:hypothetical protein
MADSFTQVTVQPEISAVFIKKEELEVLDKFFSREEVIRNGQKEIYFFSENYSYVAFDEKEKEIPEGVMIALSQRIIKRSKGSLKYIYLHAAYTCSKMHPDGFGGWVVFVRKDSVDYFSTWKKLEGFMAKK